MSHPRLGERMPNGFHIGDLVTYGRPDNLTYGFVTATPRRYGQEGWAHGDDHTWAWWANTGGGQEAAEEQWIRAARRGFEGGETWTETDEVTLVRRYNGDVTQEGSTPMVDFNGEQISIDMQPEEFIEGQEYRVIYIRDYHNFEFIGRATQNATPGRTARFEILRWVRENEQAGWSNRQYPTGHAWSASSLRRTAHASDVNVIILPATPPPPPEPTDTTFDGQRGEFLPHEGQIPEHGTIVRGLNSDTRQIEGTFIAMDGEGAATLRAQRRRRVNSNGTFGEWEAYENTPSRQVRVAGATVFKAGATPADQPEVHYRRGAAIEDRGGSLVRGAIVSAVGYNQSDNVWRGAFQRRIGTDGRVVILATHRAQMDTYNTDGVYEWAKIDPREITVWMDRNEARQGWNRAGYHWEPLAPGEKPVDPQFDPARKTQHTGMGIGDMVVGTVSSSRDTVGNWVRGEIIKWKRSNPVVRVTDKMESSKKVGDEVEVIAADTYPALADPKGADPDEFKKTLRLYLIGRHKHGDFCRGGLNTMLAAFGIPLYETRRQATVVVTVDYDPNSVDLYQVQSQLASGMAGVNGITISEREGNDFEVEADVTGG